MRQSNKQSKPIDKGKVAKQMMSAATAAGSSNAAFVYKIPVPPIDAAANRVLQTGVQAGYGSGATNFVSACGRGYGNKCCLKKHLHGCSQYRRCADPRCISQAIEYPIVRRNQRV
jgi:hypothetical protein